ncbi:MAG: sigma-70 family RNA polymerase sigma factor [Flavobacteriales bacterium]|nr:sigma-70 family RNA polymerase sigma factor [Flavobacteriales bacterium]
MEKERLEHIKKRLREGDSSCFTPLVNEYKDMVYALALKMCQSAEDAEEVAQDTFVKAYKGFGRFKGDSKLSTWLYQIAYFTAINHLRKKKVETTDVDISHVPQDDSVWSQIQEQDRKAYLDRAFELLKPEERAVINLFYLEEHSMDEISKITGLSVSNVKVKVHRSRKKLYGILQLLLKNEINSLL